MAKEGLLKMQGVVTEVLPDFRFRIRLDNGHSLVAYSGGKLRNNNIRILPGDRVSLEMSPYDMSKGRIIYRYLDPATAPVQRVSRQRHRSGAR